MTRPLCTRRLPSRSEARPDSHLPMWRRCARPAPTRRAAMGRGKSFSVQLQKAADRSMTVGAHLPDDPATLLNDADFALVRQLIADYAGIKLSPQKRNMAYNRLLRRLR